MLRVVLAGLVLVLALMLGLMMDPRGRAGRGAFRLLLGTAWVPVTVLVLVLVGPWTGS